jgi:hypothetical protein
MGHANFLRTSDFQGRLAFRGLNGNRSDAGYDNLDQRIGSLLAPTLETANKQSEPTATVTSDETKSIRVETKLPFVELQFPKTDPIYSKFSKYVFFVAKT